MNESEGPITGEQPIIDGEYPEMDYDIIGKHVEDAFDIAEALRAKDHEIYSTITGPDGEEIELTPDNHTISPSGFEGRYHVHLREIKKGVAIAGGIIVTGAVLFKAARSIRERKKNQ